jgi:hypothetical protein
VSALVQRWRAGRDRYRVAGEPIDPRRYEVEAIPDDRTAKAFVHAHHYSRSYPAARYRFGLRRGAELVGVAVFSVPAQPRCLDVLPCDRAEAVELGRFVLLDEVPANGETWLLGRCFELLRREGIRGVVSFSDPVRRTAADGTVVAPGHLGVIYQAHNAVYLGRSKPDTLRLLPDGSCLHRRALAKLRNGERGWGHVAALLADHGAPEQAGGEAWGEWVARAVAAVTRRARHSGNHKYAWTIDRRLRRHMPPSLPYPKALAA